MPPHDAPTPLPARAWRPLLALAFGVALSLTLSAGAHAATAWTDGQAATRVLGADNFTTAGDGTASASRFFGPSDICTDPATGKVFVIAYQQHRILRFAADQAVTNGGVAEAVFGQPDLNSTTANNSGRSAKSLSSPFACAIDAAGRLFVTDSGNRRVLRYDNAATKPSSAAADGVLGQADFTSDNTATTANRFAADNLYGIALGPNGALYVSDPGNRRVLRFDNAAAKANGADADGVLGAADLTTAGAGGTTASTFSARIFGLTVDTSGNLYVSDANNRRILRFNNAAAKANGAAADGVLGAPNFTTAGTGTASASTISNTVYGIDVLADGALYAADFNFHRVLVYNNPAAKANGGPADQVLGQANFSSAANALTASGLSNPIGLDYNAQAGYLMIADYNHNRVVGHSAPTPVNGSCGTSASQTLIQAPTAGLCSAGTSSTVTSANGSYTWQCQGSSGGTSSSCQAQWASTGGGSGSITPSTTNGWQVASASFSTTPPAPAPQGVSLPGGLLSLNLTAGVSGSDATVVVHFTDPVPAGAVYMKYGRSPDGFNCTGAACALPHWYELPTGRAVVAADRLSATLTLTDGGLGDHDGAANQAIEDPGGFALRAGPAGAQGIPTLGEWGVWLLSALAAVFGLRAVRRRPA